MTNTSRRSQFSVLKDLAELVKELFTAEVNAKRVRVGQPGSYRPGTSWDWISVATYIMSKRLSPPVWIHYVVQQMPIPQPNHLKSNKILARYQQTARERAAQARRSAEVSLASDRSAAYHELASLLESQAAGDFESELSGDELIAMVAANDCTDLTPLFRYCWCAEKGLGGLADSYLMEAFCQYSVASEEYDSVWGEWIPQDLRELTRKLFSEYV